MHTIELLRIVLDEILSGYIEFCISLQIEQELSSETCRNLAAVTRGTNKVS